MPIHQSGIKEYFILNIPWNEVKISIVIIKICFCFLTFKLLYIRLINGISKNNPIYILIYQALAISNSTMHLTICLIPNGSPKYIALYPKYIKEANT